MLLQSGNSHQLVPTDSLTTNGQHQFSARSFMVLRDVFCSHRFAVILIVRICTDLYHQRNLHVDDHLPFRSSHNLSQPPPFTRTVNSIIHYCLHGSQTICLWLLFFRAAWQARSTFFHGSCSLVLGTVAGRDGHRNLSAEHVRQE